MTRAPTKDPHVAQIDALEKIHQIKMKVKYVMEQVKAKQLAGHRLTPDEIAVIKAFRQQAIDATRRAQDEFFEELEAHGFSQS